jgi:hypothetical protein
VFRTAHVVVQLPSPASVSLGPRCPVCSRVAEAGAIAAIRRVAGGDRQNIPRPPRDNPDWEEWWQCGALYAHRNGRWSASDSHGCSSCSDPLIIQTLTQIVDERGQHAPAIVRTLPRLGVAWFPPNEPETCQVCGAGRIGNTPRVRGEFACGSKILPSRHPGIRDWSYCLQPRIDDLIDAFSEHYRAPRRAELDVLALRVDRLAIGDEIAQPGIPDWSSADFTPVEDIQQFDAVKWPDGGVVMALLPPPSTIRDPTGPCPLCGERAPTDPVTRTPHRGRWNCGASYSHEDVSPILPDAPFSRSESTACRHPSPDLVVETLNTLVGAAAGNSPLPQLPHLCVSPDVAPPPLRECPFCGSAEIPTDVSAAEEELQLFFNLHPCGYALGPKRSTRPCRHPTFAWLVRAAMLSLPDQFHDQIAVLSDRVVEAGIGKRIAQPTLPDWDNGRFPRDPQPDAPPRRRRWWRFWER